MQKKQGGFIKNILSILLQLGVNYGIAKSRELIKVLNQEVPDVPEELIDFNNE